MKKRFLFYTIVCTCAILIGGCTNKPAQSEVTPTEAVTQAPEQKDDKEPANNNQKTNNDNPMNWWLQQATPTPQTEQGNIIKRDDNTNTGDTASQAELDPDSIYAKLGISTTRKFTTYVFSITGKPEDLTLKPDGLFYGTNYELRGRESERPVHIDVWNPEGELIISQNCGLRLYGAYSRQNFLKSIKLFAREEYEPEMKTFKYDFFGKEKLDGSEKDMKKYKKLVLRNSGNDYQFAWIRDELNQTLAKDAGFDVYESVAPAVYYLNGEYRGLYWLHESYCDKYFKELFGEEGKNGEFAICEGGEQEKKTDDDDAIIVQAATEYNKAYNEFIKMDLTIDANYEKLEKFMDVESYLKFFAYNIYLCNKDWPDNNYKCYRYYAADGEAYEATGSVYDGRWRFLLHDMDYTMGLYGHEECMANYDNLEDVMSPTTLDEDGKTVIENKRYAPLFTALMKRDDCKQFFADFTMSLAKGALSKQNIEKVLNEMNDERLEEVDEFYNYLSILKAKGEGDIWVWRDNFDNATKEIGAWAKQRANYSKNYLKKNLGVDVEY